VSEYCAATLSFRNFNNRLPPPVLPSRFSVNYRYSEAVSELASDYSGCSSLIVSATSPADREESFPSGTVALDHELSGTFTGEEESVSENSRGSAASCGYSFQRNGVH